jgi:hypothetical protein
VCVPGVECALWADQPIDGKSGEFPPHTHTENRRCTADTVDAYSTPQTHSRYR